MSETNKTNQDHLREAGVVDAMNECLQNFAIGKPFYENVELLDKMLKTICALSDNR